MTDVSERDLRLVEEKLQFVEEVKVGELQHVKDACVGEFKTGEGCFGRRITTCG